jgi:hypothetical protein
VLALRLDEMEEEMGGWLTDSCGLGRHVDDLDGCWFLKKRD